MAFHLSPDEIDIHKRWKQMMIACMGSGERGDEDPTTTLGVPPQPQHLLYRVCSSQCDISSTKTELH